MLSFQWICIPLALAACCLLKIILFVHKRKFLPPGPKGFPILGNLHLLGKNPHQDLCRLARKHGPIMHMRLGCVTGIIVSSPEAAEQFLKKNDQVFAGRPYNEGVWHVSYEQRSLIFGQYGPYWRNMRKLCVLHMLSSQKIQSMQPMRGEEVGDWVKSLRQGSSEGRAVDLTAAISSLSADIVFMMIFGEKYSDKDVGKKGITEVIRELVHYVAVPNLGEFIPWLSVLDIQGLRRRFKELSKVLDSFLEKVLDEHVQSRRGGKKQTKDFVDIMLELMDSREAEFEFDRRHIKAIMLDLLVASMDSTSAVIEWAISDLIKHPEAMNKLQKELGQKVGMHRKVEESDLEGLEYLDMVVKESLRFHPPGPLLLPHESVEECEVGGFRIPKKSRIMINIWAISRDPSVWHDPESFIPERFIDDKMDVQGHDFRLIPFGFGRRVCPGLELGLLLDRFVVAQLAHCFDWKLADGVHPQDLDMSEEFGIVAARARHLTVTPVYRLEK